MLTGVSLDELEELAAGILVPQAHARLDHLLASAKNENLTASEQVELDCLLIQVDQLNLLKARAQYTLQQTSAKAS